MAFNRSEATSSSGFYEILFISFLFYSVNCISYMCEGLYRERERERERVQEEARMRWYTCI